jgi:hypothetical protein
MFDLGLLEPLARSWASTIELEQLLARDGLVLESANGVRKAHPGLAALDRARSAVHRQLADLALTPPGRERVAIDPQTGAYKRKPWERDPAHKYLGDP